MTIAYDTVSEAVNDLHARGYNLDFNVDFDCVVCEQHPIKLNPSEFEIAEVHRFEGNSDPADEAIVYAIESRHGQKGVIVNGYGTTAESLSSDMVEKLTVRPSKN